MIISRQFTAICRGCKQPFNLYEYKGLEGGLYGNHNCPEIRQLFLDRPRIRKVFEKLKELT